jgi:hypothetical protein
MHALIMGKHVLHVLTIHSQFWVSISAFALDFWYDLFAIEDNAAVAHVFHSFVHSLTEEIKKSYFEYMSPGQANRRLLKFHVGERYFVRRPKTNNSTALKECY